MEETKGLGYEYIIKYKPTEEKVKVGFWNDTNDIEEVKNNFLELFPNTTITYIALWTDEEREKYRQEQINKCCHDFLEK